MIDLGSNGIVQISETGDRVSDYSLFDLNPKSGQFEVIENEKFLSKQKNFFFVMSTGSRNLFWCKFFIYSWKRYLLD
jgi:hypothetical protein